MNGTIRCFSLTVGALEIAMPTGDISALRRGVGRPNSRFAWLEDAQGGGVRLVFDLARIFFPHEGSRPTRAVVLSPGAVPEGLKLSFSAREAGRRMECVFLCDRMDRELDIPASILRPLPDIVNVAGVLGAFSHCAFLNGAAYPLLRAEALILKVVRLRRSLP